MGSTALASDVSADREAALQALRRGKDVSQTVARRAAPAQVASTTNAPCDKDCCTRALRNTAPSATPEFTDHG